MPTVYLRKDLYDDIVKRRLNPNTFVANAVEEALKLKDEGAALKLRAKPEPRKGKEA